MIDQTCQQLSTVIEEISRFLRPTFAQKKFSLICKPSETGRRYYTDNPLLGLCLECARRAMKERDAFDMTGMYLIRNEPDVPVDRFNRCTVCRGWLETSRLTLEGLQICLASPDYSHCAYPYPFMTTPELAWQFKVICKSARYWVQVLFDSGELPAFVDHIKAFAERLVKVNEHWLTQAHSGFVSFGVKGQKRTMKPVLLVEAAYNESDQTQNAYDMDVLFVNNLCSILGIDSQVWRYADHDRPHNEGR